MFFYFFLRIELFLQSIRANSDIIKEWFELILVWSKHVPQHWLIDEGLGVPVIIEPDSSLPKFIDVNRNSGIKSSHNSFHLMHWNAPYSKKSKYVVNTKCVKIITHLFESFPPPSETILFHF